jgi:hypothetical protein
MRFGRDLTSISRGRALDRHRVGIDALARLSINRQLRLWETASNFAFCPALLYPRGSNRVTVLGNSASASPESRTRQMNFTETLMVLHRAGVGAYMHGALVGFCGVRVG